MPVKLLFDIEPIDLSACLYDKEAIGKFNPHRGAFALLDRVVWIDDTLNRAIAVKNVRDDEFWVDGHIPGRPLMPGVLMVEAGAQLASVLYYKRSDATWFAGFTRIEDTAFRGQVVPGDELILLAKVKKYHLKRFVSRVQGVVNGNIVFESLITGMAFPRMGNVRAQTEQPHGSFVGTSSG